MININLVHTGFLADQSTKVIKWGPLVKPDPPKPEHDRTPPPEPKPANRPAETRTERPITIVTVRPNDQADPKNGKQIGREIVQEFQDRLGKALKKRELRSGPGNEPLHGRLRVRIGSHGIVDRELQTITFIAKLRGPVNFKEVIEEAGWVVRKFYLPPGMDEEAIEDLRDEIKAGLDACPLIF